MEKRVFAKADIEQLHRAGQTVLRLEPGDTVTPLARDTAFELGVTIYGPGEAPPAEVPAPAAPAAPDEKIEQLVQAVLARVKEKAPPCPVPAVYGTRPGAVKLASMPKETELPLYELRDPAGNLVPPPEIGFRLLDVVTVKDGSSMGGGFMSWSKGGFNWTLTYDQIDFVLEGVMEVTCEGRTIRAYPGDVTFIPKGSSIRWSTPSWVKIYYVTFPAEWAAA